MLMRRCMGATIKFANWSSYGIVPLSLLGNLCKRQLDGGWDANFELCYQLQQDQVTLSSFGIDWKLQILLEVKFIQPNYYKLGII